MSTERFATIADYEAAARKMLEGRGSLFGRLGDPTWLTSTSNRLAFDALRIRPRVLTGTKTRNIATSVLGTPLALPVIIAPSGGHQRMHAQGELATARAAGAAGTIMTVSTVANFSIEEIAEVATGALWFQLYFLKDRGVTIELIRRAEAAGYKALVLTVDNVAGRLSAEVRRELDPNWGPAARRSTTLEPDRLLRNLANHPHLRLPGEGSIGDWVEDGLSWADLDWMRSQTSLPIIVKGIQAGEDARLAVEHGAAAIAVSNHGGVPMEMEGLQAAIDALPEVIEAVDGRVEVYVDGGVRCGRDVLAALALGARAVMIGRPVQWALAAGGEAGIVDMVDILRRELLSIMGIAGIADVGSVPRNTIVRQPAAETMAALQELYSALVKNPR